MTKDVSEFKIMELSDYLEKFNQDILNSTFSRKLDALDNFFIEKTRVGLDIGSHSVKLVEVEQIKKEWVVVGLGHGEIPGGHLHNKEQDTAVVELTRDLWQRHKVRTRQVSLVISDPVIYLRHVNIPVVPEEELVRAIRWQAEKYIPFSIDEALVDFQPLSSRIKDSTNQMEIVIVAVEKKIIERYLAILKEARLTAARVDIAPFAVARSFRHNYQFDEDEIVPVIDIGSQNTALVLMKKGTLQLVRNFDIAGHHLTDAIAKDRNITRDKAEELKKISSSALDLPGIPHEETVFSAVEPVLMEWIDQVNRSLAYCEKELGNEKIQQVFLCGGGANFPGMDKFLSARLNLAVRIASPFNKIRVSERLMKIADTDKLAPLFMAAVGQIV